MRRVSEVYTVRNSHGQLLGRYRAMTALQAIQRHKDEQRAYFSQFKGTARDCGFAAKVEK